jgi:glycosyltransferase involved in cell wall biosynthesis
MEDASAGIFIEPENPQELVNAILTLAANPDWRRTMGQNGRDYVAAHFSREKTAEAYIVVLRDVLAKACAT